MAILLFVGAEADDTALALAGAALIHNEGIVPQGEATLHTAAQIPLRVAAIAVEHQLNGGVGVADKVKTMEGQAVVRADGKFLPGQSAHLIHPGLHLIPIGFIDPADGDGVIVGANVLPLGNIEGLEETVNHNAQRNGCKGEKYP